MMSGWEERTGARHSRVATLRCALLRRHVAVCGALWCPVTSSSQLQAVVYLSDTQHTGARDLERGAEASSQRGRRHGERERQVGAEFALGGGGGSRGVVEMS